MSSLKDFEDATLWRPSLRPVKTTEGPKRSPIGTNDVLGSSKNGHSGSINTPPTCACESARTVHTESPECFPCVDSPQYRTDNFMMYGFKVALCSRPGRHRWDECPFAHPTENARRRDPRVFSYSCQECPSYRNAGYCPRGDLCEYSHGVFEARLHPDSYRTVSCKDGANCRRKICFFYHSESEKRTPTGLHEARAQIAAELGESALDISGDTLRAVANSLLTSSPSLTNTVQSLNSAFSQPICQNQSLRSGLSMGNGNNSPLAASQSGPNTPGISAALSNLSLGGGNSANLGNSTGLGNSGLLMTSETVAPCLKGANRNKAKLRELANEVGVHAETLMNSLRVAALQGELTSQSMSSTAAFGTFNSFVENILEEISESEEVPLNKLRGWLLRQTTHCSSPHRRSGTPTHRMNSSPMYATFSPQSKTESPHHQQQATTFTTSIQRRTATQNRASPTDSGHSSIGPVLPPSHDEVIRAYNQQGSYGSKLEKSTSGTWRRSSSTGKATSNQGLGDKKGSHEGLYRNSASRQGTSQSDRW